jgi:hypothetical protein
MKKHQLKEYCEAEFENINTVTAELFPIIKSGSRLGNSMRLDKGQIEVIDDVMAGILRKKTPAERIHIGFEMWISGQKMLFSHLRATYPHWSNEQLNREVARRLSHGTV